jgi:hypothetical protein
MYVRAPTRTACSGAYRVIIASEKQNLLRRPQYLLRVHMIDYQKLVLSIETFWPAITIPFFTGPWPMKLTLFNLIQ